jgi:hypothetical protein
VIHPVFHVPLTDAIGQVFVVGDEVLVPVRNRAHSRHYAAGGAVLTRAKVLSIEALVPKPGNWISTGPDSRTPFVRESQVGHKKAPEFFPPTEQGIGYSGPIDKSKCSVVSVEYPNGTTGSFRYNGIVRVSDA